ncbi:hypothetical protein K9L67_03590 [Candidatus Woesearchaeota archaeon]|nr:hypothetical protein [Candidatus Woesearchaeota archaeon]MCF7901284.1 hypothetical protein [Candidatus Woesearchaeota archaeon]MCF8013775.1 hypothetical protein [Candidatus Woesearchaeota archaeon]
MKKEDYVQVCPKCQSVDIEHDFSQPAMVAGGIFAFKCNNCKHISSVFPEIHVRDLHKPKNPKSIKDKDLETTQLGKGFLGVFKFIGPLGILVSIILLANSMNIWPPIFSIAFFTAISFLALDNDIHLNPSKRKLLGFLIILYVLFIGII